MNSLVRGKLECTPLVGGIRMPPLDRGEFGMYPLVRGELERTHLIGGNWNEPPC